MRARTDIVGIPSRRFAELQDSILPHTKEAKLGEISIFDYFDICDRITDEFYKKYGGDVIEN